jgi:radical SAM protein with 4Fe4S-binding SPASM domain
MGDREPKPNDALVHIDDVRIHGHFPSWCVQLFREMSINTDGSLSPCTEIADCKTNIGSLLDGDLQALWNGEKYKKARRYVLGKTVNGSICEGCVRGESASLCT